MAEHQTREEQARREDELAEFFASRPEVSNRGFAAKVRLTKAVLPLVALVLLAAVVVWPLLSRQESSVTLSYSALEQSGDEIRMVEPHYLGTDNKDRPFMIAASAAVQQGVNAKEVVLDEVRASLRLNGGDDVTAAATRGVYMPDEERLELSDGIHLEAGGGYSFDGDSLSLEINEGRVKGAGGVNGKAPFGVFEANEFSADIAGRSLALDGKVRVRLDPGYNAENGTANGAAGPEAQPEAEGAVE